MMNGQNWQCPFCQHFQVLSEHNLHSTSGTIGSKLNKHGVTVGRITIVECMNPSCKEFYARADLGDAYRRGQSYFSGTLGNTIFSHTLRPVSFGRPQSDYIPAPLREDYDEACLIRDFSPKASATLARRCLQGMIRDFCGISKGRLIDEIKVLADSVESGSADRSVSAESVTAIDHVRSLGNIGAHMEKDINTIIEVDPGEAQALIELIELLFDEWYGARYRRQQKLALVEAISLSKKSPLKSLPTETAA